MSTKAPVVTNVEKVEVDLTEKGLTELAKMLVQSGRMSAPSFTNWCSRVSSQGSRWARIAQGDSSMTGKPGKRPEKKKVRSIATAAKDGDTSEGSKSKKSIKDGFKLSGLKKANPPFDTTSWESVLASSDEVKTQWYQWTKTFLSMAENKALATRELFNSLNLSEEEMKGSRAWFPILPGKAEKELYDGITPDPALQVSGGDVEITDTSPKVECPPKDSIDLSMTKEAPTSSAAAVRPIVSNVWDGNSSAAVMNSNAGRTGTLLPQELAKKPSPKKGYGGGGKTAYTNVPSKRKANKSGRGYY
jgi:hypothetical protein